MTIIHSTQRVIPLAADFEHHVHVGEFTRALESGCFARSSDFGFGRCGFGRQGDGLSQLFTRQNAIKIVIFSSLFVEHGCLGFLSLLGVGATTPVLPCAGVALAITHFVNRLADQTPVAFAHTGARLPAEYIIGQLQFRVLLIGVAIKRCGSGAGAANLTVAVVGLGQGALLRRHAGAGVVYRARECTGAVVVRLVNQAGHACRRTGVFAVTGQT